MATDLARAYSAVLATLSTRATRQSWASMHPCTWPCRVSVLTPVGGGWATVASNSANLASVAVPIATRSASRRSS